MLFLCEKTIFSLYLYKSYFKDIFIPNYLKTTSLEIFRCVKISMHSYLLILKYSLTFVFLNLKCPLTKGIYFCCRKIIKYTTPPLGNNIKFGLSFFGVWLLGDNSYLS